MLKNGRELGDYSVLAFTKLSMIFLLREIVKYEMEDSADSARMSGHVKIWV